MQCEQSTKKWVQLRHSLQRERVEWQLKVIVKGGGWLMDGVGVWWCGLQQLLMSMLHIHTCLVHMRQSHMHKNGNTLIEGWLRMIMLICCGTVVFVQNHHKHQKGYSHVITPHHPWHKHNQYLTAWHVISNNMPSHLVDSKCNGVDSGDAYCVVVSVPFTMSFCLCKH